MILPDQFFVILIKYLELKDVIRKLMLLNKNLHHLVQAENYLLFKHFLRNFNLLSLKRTDIPAKVSVMQLMRENYLLR